MKVLITGGSGLIGSTFIEAFAQHEYTVLTRSPMSSMLKLPKGVAFLHQLEELSDLNEFDAVINLAGEPIVGKRWSEQQKAIICESRWRTTEQLVGLFKNSQSPPKVFLSGSAVGVYGDRGAAKLTESSSISDDDFASELCARWEAIAKHAEPYTRVVLLRTGIVLAQRGGALGKMLLPFKCFLGGRLGRGEQYMSWIHCTDMINAINHLLNDNTLSGPINLTAPTPVTNKTFTALLAKTLHRFAIMHVPSFFLKVLLGEASSILLCSQRVLPTKLLQSGFNFKYDTLSSALTALTQRK